MDFLGALEPRAVAPPVGAAGIRAALDAAAWDDGTVAPVFDRIPPDGRACIVVSDHTRRTAADRVLPVLAEEAAKRGVSTGRWSVLVASGIHRRPTAQEMRAILGPASAMFGDRVFFHDADDAANLVAVGSLPDGHVVRINRMAVETDCLILLGAAAYHYHAGFGGGRKSLVPGIAGRDTVAHNHSRTLDPSADRIHPGVGPGLLEGNPVHESMLSAALMRPPAFIVNTVLTPSGELAGVYCGGMVAAHRAACRHVERIERADIRRGADLVVASAEDARDWIQSHKALVNAHRAIRSGGRIVLVAPCPEGLGNERFRHWVRKNTAEAVFRELRNQPEVLGQTALSTIARGAAAVLVTAMRAEDVRDLGIRAVSDFDAALDLVLRELSEEGCERPTCYAMPRGRHCVPFITG